MALAELQQPLQSKREIDPRYYDIVRDEELWQVARMEALETFRKRYEQAYVNVPDEDARKELVNNGVSTINNEWYTTLGEYYSKSAACNIQGNRSACENMFFKEERLALLLATADDERKQFGDVPFISPQPLYTDREVVLIDRQTQQHVADD